MDAKMAQLVADGMHWKHTDFVKHAAQLVIQCRRVLAWSYARAFYIADKNAKTLFEFRQSELEQYTEKLVGDRASSGSRARKTEEGGQRWSAASLSSCSDHGSWIIVCACMFLLPPTRPEPADGRLTGAADSRSPARAGLDACTRTGTNTRRRQQLRTLL
jgi:hypothetical protein